MVNSVKEIKMDPTLNSGTSANAIIDCIAVTIDRVLWPITAGMYAGLVVTLMMLVRRGQRIGPALLAIVLLAIAAFPLEPFFQITRPPFTTWREALATAWAAVPHRLELALLGLCLGAAVGLFIHAWHGHSSHAPSTIASKAMLLIALAAAPLASGGCIRADVHLVPDKLPVAKAGERNAAVAAPEKKPTESPEAGATETARVQEEKSREALRAEIGELERLRDLRALERDEAAHKAAEAARNAATAEKEAARVADDLQHLKAEKQQTQAEIAALVREKEQAEQQASEADERRAADLGSVSQLEAKVAALGGEIKEKEEALAELEAAGDEQVAAVSSELKALKDALWGAENLLVQKRKQLESLTATEKRLTDAINSGGKALAAIDADISSKSNVLARLEREIEAARAVQTSTHVTSRRESRQPLYFGLTGAVLAAVGAGTLVVLRRRRGRDCRILLGWRDQGDSAPQQYTLRFNPRVEEVCLGSTGPRLSPHGAETDGPRLQVRGSRLRLIPGTESTVVRVNASQATDPVRVKAGDEITLGDESDVHARLVVRDFDRFTVAEEEEELKTVMEAMPTP